MASVSSCRAKPGVDGARGVRHCEDMSTLAEVESAVADFSVEELTELERFVRKTRRMKFEKKQHSVLDIEPSHLGEILRPLGTRDEWYDEMLEGRV